MGVVHTKQRRQGMVACGLKANYQSSDSGQMGDELFNRENNKDHISQSRGSTLDGEEHVGEWKNLIEKIT